jgi:hypothetical protein
MKCRHGHVTNSSSSSFVLSKEALTPEERNLLDGYIKKFCDYEWGDIKRLISDGTFKTTIDRMRLYSEIRKANLIAEAQTHEVGEVYIVDLLRYWYDQYTPAQVRIQCPVCESESELSGIFSTEYDLDDLNDFRCPYCDTIFECQYLGPSDQMEFVILEISDVKTIEQIILPSMLITEVKK